MNWIHFLRWLAGIYSLYYLVVILWDKLKSNLPKSANGATNELTFSEQITPQDAAGLLENTATRAANRPPISTPDIIASGGVLLKDVFSMARKEAIVYIKEVSY